MRVKWGCLLAAEKSQEPAQSRSFPSLGLFAECPSRVRISGWGPSQMALLTKEP